MAARFITPYGITADGANLYVADIGGQLIRKIAPLSGTLADMTSARANVSTLAGAAITFGVVDGDGTAARFWNPWGITTDGKRLFIGDSAGGTVRVME